MSIYTSLLTAGTNSHQETSENANAVATDFVSQGVIGAVTNTSGVAPMTGAFAVNAQASPNMTVAVSSGVAYVTATPTSQNSQTLRVRNTASTNVTISANTSGSTKYDWLYIQIDPTKAANPAVDASDVATLVTSRSSSSTADNGTPPTYGYCIAVITVANGAPSITNGNITDKRVLAYSTQIEKTSNLYNPYKFSVYRSAALSPSNGAAILFDTTIFDTSSNYSAGSGKFTAPIAGFYQFTGALAYSATGANLTAGLFLAKNGTAVAAGSLYVQMYNGTTSAYLSVVSFMLQLAANDYVQVTANNPSTLALSVGSPNCYFQGFLVSAV